MGGGLCSHFPRIFVFKKISNLINPEKFVKSIMFKYLSPKYLLIKENQERKAKTELYGDLQTKMNQCYKTEEVSYNGKLNVLRSISLG